MTTVLDSIVAGVREDLAARVERVSLAELARRVDDAPAPIDAEQLLRAEGLSLIAEVKRASPSRGALADIADPAALARTYAEAGATTVVIQATEDEPDLEGFIDLLGRQVQPMLHR